VPPVCAPTRTRPAYVGGISRFDGASTPPLPRLHTANHLPDNVCSLARRKRPRSRPRYLQTARHPRRAFTPGRRAVPRDRLDRRSMAAICAPTSIVTHAGQSAIADFPPPPPPPPRRATPRLDHPATPPPSSSNPPLPRPTPPASSVTRHWPDQRAWPALLTPAQAGDPQNGDAGTSAARPLEPPTRSRRTARRYAGRCHPMRTLLINITTGTAEVTICVDRSQAFKLSNRPPIMHL